MIGVFFLRLVTADTDDLVVDVVVATDVDRLAEVDTVDARVIAAAGRDDEDNDNAMCRTRQI